MSHTEIDHKYNMNFTSDFSNTWIEKPKLHELSRKGCHELQEAMKFHDNILFFGITLFACLGYLGIRR